MSSSWGSVGRLFKPPHLTLIWYLPAWKCTSSGSQFMLKLAALPLRALPPSPIHTPSVRYGLCDFGHGFVVVWREGVSCWVLFVSRAWKTHAGTCWNWATNHSWNGYRHGVPMGFLYQVTSQNNIGQYFKRRNEGFRGCSQPGVWDSVWNSWTCSSAFDLHGRWAIKCMKHVGNTWGNSAWPCCFLGTGRALSGLILTSRLSAGLCLEEQTQEKRSLHLRDSAVILSAVLLHNIPVRWVLSGVLRTWVLKC